MKAKTVNAGSGMNKIIMLRNVLLFSISLLFISQWSFAQPAETVFKRIHCSGMVDSFTCPAEPASPDTAIIDSLTSQYSNTECYGFLDFDEIPNRPGCIHLPNAFFVHTFKFTVPGGGVTSATLKFRARAASSGQTSSDFIAFFEGTSFLTGSMLKDLPGASGTWNHNQDVTFILSLANLPSSFFMTNIIPYLNDGDLDIVIGNETGVDWMCLYFPVRIIAAERWNMLSNPFPFAKARTDLFPDAISEAWGYTAAGYVPRDSLKGGEGYWLKFQSEKNIDIEGEEYDSLVIPVYEGWNLIGSFHLPVSVSSIESNPAGLVTSQFFGYRNGYFVADTIESGRAYWVKVREDGELILSATAATQQVSKIRIVPINELPPTPPDGALSNLIPTKSGQTPNRYALHQAYPNPFNPSTVIQFDLPEPAVVTLKVYNTLGQEVAVLLDHAEMDAAFHQIAFDASLLGSGLYVYRLTAGKFTDVKKILLIR